MDTDLIRKAAKAIPSDYEDLPFALEQLADEIDTQLLPIPVTDRLPENHQVVLVYISGEDGQKTEADLWTLAFYVRRSDQSAYWGVLCDLDGQNKFSEANGVLADGERGTFWSTFYDGAITHWLPLPHRPE